MHPETSSIPATLHEAAFFRTRKATGTGRLGSKRNWLHEAAFFRTRKDTPTAAACIGMDRFNEAAFFERGKAVVVVVVSAAS